MSEKEIININFPHPVLGNGSDYTNGYFRIKADEQIVNEVDKIIIQQSYELNSEYIETLIADGKASAAIYLQSVMTGYRKIYYFDNNKKDILIKIDNTLISGKLILKGLIVAKETMNEFKSDEQNEVFGNAGFEIDKGGILAISQEIIYNLDDFDPLRDKPSVFRIRVASDEQKKDIILDTSGDLVYIIIRKELYDKYDYYKTNADVSVLLGSLFVIPALVEILANMRDNKYIETGEELKWYKTIKARLEKCNIDLQNCESLITAANELVASVFNNALDKIKIICRKTFETDTEVE